MPEVPDRATNRRWEWAMVVAVVVIAVGGALILYEEASERTRALGLNLLALGILGLCISAFGAFLTRRRNLGNDADRKIDSPMARLIFVVRRDRHDLYDTLRACVAGQTGVEVILDRRLPPWRPGTSEVEITRPHDERRRRLHVDLEVYQRGWSVARVPN